MYMSPVHLKITFEEKGIELAYNTMKKSNLILNLCENGNFKKNISLRNHKVHLDKDFFTYRRLFQNWSKMMKKSETNL